MAKLSSFLVILCVYLLALLMWRVESFDMFNPQDDTVILRRISALRCEGVERPEGEEQVCFIIELTPDPDDDNFFGYNCTVIGTMDRRPLNFTGNSLTIRSPEFGSGEDYPENLVCLYNIPTHCPNKRHIHRVQWTRGDFVLEPAVDVGFLDDTCSDFVELITTSNVTKLRDGGAILRDRIQPTAACGTQTEFSDHNSGPTLNLTFHSSRERPARGFKITIQCADAMDLLGTEITPPPQAVFSGAESFPQINSSLDRVNVPNDAFITFRRNTLKIIRGRTKVEVFLRGGITRLFFWTGFNGTRAFMTTAAVPDDEIFGGGTLIFVNGCAYYATFNIPPRFIPNSNEVEILNVILRAVSVFSLPRDQGAPGSGEPTGTPGSGGPTGSPGSGGPTGLPETGKPQDPHKPHKGPILPDPLPFGYDLEAVRKGCRYRLSTNPFLRQAIADYFELLGIFPCPAP